MKVVVVVLVLVVIGYTLGLLKSRSELKKSKERLLKAKKDCKIAEENLVNARVVDVFLKDKFNLI